MPKKVLMVCLGNICRSPLAEGILQSKISKDLCIVDSAGTANYHVGEAPDYRSIAAAKNMVSLSTTKNVVNYTLMTSKFLITSM